MFPLQDPSRTCFVGNIAYEASESLLRDFFAQYNLNIKSVRFLTDKQTGRPRGIAYVEFFEQSQAETAIRHLNNQEFMGRGLRVSKYEENARPSGPGGRGYGGTGGGFPSRGGMGSYDREGPAGDFYGGPGAPMGHADSGIPVGMEQAVQSEQQVAASQGFPINAHPDEISQVLSSMTKFQLYEVLSQLKAIDQQDSNRARNLLSKNPALARAVFQAEVILGLVKPTAPAAYGAPPAATQPPPPMQYARQPPPPGVPEGYGAPQPAPTAAAYGGAPMPPPPRSAPTLAGAPASYGGYPPGPTPQLASIPAPQQLPVQQQITPQLGQPMGGAAPAAPATAPPQQAAALNLVMSLTPEQIAQLPPEKREKVLDLRRKFGMQ